jgi:iron(III) transport system substrate-binding protein
LLVACAPPVSPPAAPASGTQSAPDPDQEWQRVIAAAKNEGKVVVVGGAGDALRDSLTLGFRAKYPDIEVEFLGLSGEAAGVRIPQEQSGGQYLMDVAVLGTTTISGTLLRAGALGPLEPFLVGPATRDRSIWRNGNFSFADEPEQYNVVLITYVKPPFVYNPNLAAAADFKSWKDLLDSRWKNRIVFSDPTASGGGADAAVFWYTNERLGKPFIRDFFAQGPVLSTISRQMIEWVAHGNYPIEIGAFESQVADFLKLGVPIKYVEPVLAEGTWVTAGLGTVGVVKQAPHPNAAKVYIDYLLSREGQLALSKAVGLASLRLDVPDDHVEPIFVPKPGVTYQENYKAKFQMLRGEVTEFVTSVMPR